MGNWAVRIRIPQRGGDDPDPHGVISLSSSNSLSGSLDYITQALFFSFALFFCSFHIFPPSYATWPYLFDFSQPLLSCPSLYEGMI